MKYVLKLLCREGGRAYAEFDIDEADLSLANGERRLFAMHIATPQGTKEVVVTSSVKKVMG